MVVFILLQELEINILGLNTRSNRETTEGYKDNYVSCVCSESTLKKVVKELEDAGAVQVKTGTLLY